MITLATAVDRIEDFYRRIYWQAPTATTQPAEGYTLTYCGIPWLHSINQLWVHNPTALNDKALAVAAKFFRRYDAEYSVVFSEPDPTSLVLWLSQKRYTERAVNPIFALEGLPRPRYFHRELRVLRAQPANQQDILNVLYSAFFMGPEIGRCAVRPDHFTEPTIQHYIGCLEDKTVACATLLLKDGIAGIWNVATLRPYRRQGIAAAVLLHCLADAAADGYPSSILVASPMGRPLYEEMGYRYVGDSMFYGPIE